MMGLRPIIEFMTFNFSLVAIDQIINTAAKAHLMSAGNIACPIVFRGAGGAAYQLGAQHANSFDSFYANTVGLTVLAPATPHDMKGMLKSAIRDENPVIFFESELTYSMKGPVPEGEYLVPIGVADVKKEGSDITLVSWSKNVHLTMQAAAKLEAEGISAEVIDLRSLRPLDETTLFNSIGKTHRCVIIQEQYEMASYGAYLSHLIYKKIFDELDAPVGLVSCLDVPMPYSKSLEEVILPSTDSIIAEVKKTLEGCR
jgi:pyruvate dehydrogenase E1 component beta subunit